MRKIFVIFCLISAFSAHDTFANPRPGTMLTWGEASSEFLNTGAECVAKGTCDLKRVFFSSYYYEVWFKEGPSYGTTMVSGFETNSVDNLENYAFVQFVRGCIFDAYQNKNGTEEKDLGHTKEQFGKSELFCFPDWVLDSMDKDPAAYGKSGEGRFYYYKWNKVRGSYDRKTEKYYGEEKPEYPSLYVTDIPTAAFLTEIYAVNVSLEFKTCLYRSKDVPLETDENNVDFGTPITCFNWNENFIYNAALGKYEQRNELDPFCLKKPLSY